MRRLAVVLVLVLAACSAEGGDQDASAKQACRKFQSLAQDSSDGVVTPDEMTDRARAIYETAQVSENVAVSGASQRFAAAMAQGDDGVAAIEDLAAACDKVDL